MNGFILRLLTDLVRGFMFRSGSIKIAHHKISVLKGLFLHSSISYFSKI